MWIHFKRFLTISFLLTLACPLFSQAIPDSLADSIRDARIKELQQQINILKYDYRIHQRNYENVIDSLEKSLAGQEHRISIQRAHVDTLVKRLAGTNWELDLTRSRMAEEEQKFRTLFLVFAPSLLFLILGTLVISLLLFNKYQEKTEMKFNALRKYTYQEMEEVKDTFMEEIKKRVKKLGKKIGGKGQKNKGKGKKSKK